METNERYAYPVPQKALERRWSLIRKAMKEQEIDCILMQNDNFFMGGYLRYFTDIAVDTYRATVVFTADGEIMTIYHGGYHDPMFPPEWAARGIKYRKMVPFVQTMIYETDEEAKITLQYIKDRHFKKVGFAGFGTISAGYYKYLTEELKGIEQVDATDLVDEIKAIKSEEEMGLIRDCVAVHDKLQAALPAIIHPGCNEFEIKAELKKAAIELGSEVQNIRLGSAKRKAMMVDPVYNHRVVHEGDELIILVEVNGPGGFFGEVGRSYCLGEPSKELVQAFEAAQKAQKMLAAMLKPGVTGAELYQANNDFLTKNGYLPEGRLLGHSQGYDMVERPVMVPSETLKFQKDMFVAIHPTALNDNSDAFLCSNYFITENGAVPLNKTPDRIFVI